MDTFDLRKMKFIILYKHVNYGFLNSSFKLSWYFLILGFLDFFPSSLVSSTRSKHLKVGYDGDYPLFLYVRYNNHQNTTSLLWIFQATVNLKWYMILFHQNTTLKSSPLLLVCLLVLKMLLNKCCYLLLYYKTTADQELN
jgi:hypothetical protein